MEVSKINGEYYLYMSKAIQGDKKNHLRKARAIVKKYSPFDIMCPIFLDTKRTIFYNGGGFTMNEKIPYPEAQGERNVNQYPKIREVNFSPFWAFIISTKTLKSIKSIPNFGMDIFIHCDFFIELKKKGFKVKVAPDYRVVYKKAYVMIRQQKYWLSRFGNLYKKFLHRHEQYLESQYKTPIMFHTHTGYPGGYCMHAREIIKSLLKKGVKINYKFVGGANDDEPDCGEFAVDDLKNDMGDHSLPQVVLSTGLNCFSCSGKYKIGFTTTEVDGVPTNWVKVLNDMDEIWTTSEFSKKSFINSGVKKPIYNMREGINPDYFHPEIKPFRDNSKKKFLFISNFAWGRRKGVDLLFEAFSKEFSDKEDVALIIKALPSYHGENIKKEMAKLYHREHGAPIHVWDTILPAYLIGGFYTAGHAFIFPTRGEGFGIPPAEALACGIPVITSNYSAVTEYLTRNGKKLPGVELINGKVKKFDGSDSVYYDGFNWFKPSIADMRKKMRKVYNNWDKYKAGAMESSKYIREEWNWDKSADLIIERINYIYKNKINKNKNDKR